LSTTVLTNAGRIVSGDFYQGYLNADTIRIEDGRIAAIGGSDLAVGAKQVIDLNGLVLMPGLIDTHTHPSFGDFTERGDSLGWIDRSVQGGVTTLVSAGECHIPGRPRDRIGSKALAMAAFRSWQSVRPRGAKVHGGAVFLEHGMTRDDFAEMASYGLWQVGEIGLSDVIDPEEAAPMVQWAHEFGFKVYMHIGGSSIPGSSTIGYEHVRRICPDVAVHLNGGPTALNDAELEAIVQVKHLGLELIYCGNFRAALTLIDLARKHNALDRMMLGNDMPSGVGVTPLGIIRMAAYLASVAHVPIEQAIAMGSGNSARQLGLDTGVIAIERPADLIVVDKPRGSQGKDALESMVHGNHPSIKLVMIDGEIQVMGSTITPGSDTQIRMRQ
jgi:enamidase